MTLCEHYSVSLRKLLVAVRARLPRGFNSPRTPCESRSTCRNRRSTRGGSGAESGLFDDLLQKRLR